MPKHLSITLAVCAAVLTIAAIYGGFGTNRELNIALQNAAKAGSTLNETGQSVNKTVDSLNDPCKGFHGAVTCGPIAQLGQTEKNIGIVAGQSAEQVKQSGKLIDTAALSLQSVATHINTTTEAATGTLNQATADLQTAQPSIAATKPVLDKLQVTQDRLNVTIATVNDGLKSQAVTSMVENFSNMTASGSAITADLHTWTHPFLNPEPCKTFKCNFSRHIWPVIQTTLGLGADANQIRMLTGHPLPVSVQP